MKNMRKIISLFFVLLCISVVAVAQPRIITGKVTNANGNPIPNASVTIKGTNKGTITKADGTYSISVLPNAKTIVFSATGSEPVEYSIGNKGVINSSLTSNDKTLSEVVVVGYGTQRKKELTGSVATISGSAVADKPNQSFDQALAGRAAGVQVTIANGVVNSPPVFRIRGTNSISLSSYPLIVVDGVPSFSGDVGTNTSAASNPLSSINPSDIESIDIAKDAASTAIYGSRAANGVVFVTTKKGKAGKVKVSYNGSVSWSNAYRLPKLLNAAQYLAFKPTAVANNPSFQVGASAIKYASVNDANGNPVDTKWSDIVYHTGISQNQNVNISGGSENTSYYFSVGYSDEQGILRKNSFKRINTLFNIDSRLSKVITIGGKISFSNENNLSATSSGSLNGAAFNTGGLARLSFVLPPIIPVYNNDGTYNLNGAAIGSSNITGISNLSYYNPQPLLDLSYGNNENNHIQSNAYLQIKPAKWLTLRSTYGIDNLLIDNNSFQTPIAGDGFASNGAAQSSLDKYKRWIWTSTAQFDYTIAEKHNISALIGNEQQRYTYSSYGISRQTLSDPAYNVVQAGYTVNNTTNLNLTENYSLSTFGRVNYNYDRKYLLSGNIRQDEFSALGVKKGIFYGVSAGWEIAREEFWANAGIDKIFSSFKFRGSYGKVGNVGGIGDYAPYSTFGSTLLYGGLATLNFSSVGNPQLKWETSKKTDLGFSFGILHDRVTAEFAYYKNTIDGLILAVKQAPSTGLPSNPLQNVGSMYNQGIEATINATPIVTKSFSWNTSFNATFNKNLVTALAPGLNVIQTLTSGNETVNQTMANYSLGYLWVIKTQGVDPTTGKRIFLNSAGTPVYYQNYVPAGQNQYSTTPNGLGAYKSPVNGGTAITQAADAVMYAPTQPKGYGGWNNTFRYKGFDLDILLTYQYGGYVYYGSNAGLHDQRWWNNAADVLTDAWQKEGDVNKKYAKPVYNDNVSNGSSMPLDINVFKGDFIKFKNLSIGYNLPTALINRMKINNFRVFVTGQNLGIITKYPGPDPEVSSNGNTGSSQGVDRNTGANARTILLGVNVSF